MRVPIALMVATLAALGLAAFSVKASESAPSVDLPEMNVEEIVEIESESAESDNQMRIDVEIPEMDIDLSKLWDKSSTDDPMVERLAIGILRSRVLKGTKDQIYWERCGKEVPSDEVVSEAAMWSAVFLDALDRVEEEDGITLNTWGAFATMANESGFNECAMNYAARVWAANHVGKELITETWKGKTVTRKVEKPVVDKFRQTYDRDTVWRILHHDDYATAKAKIKNKKTGGYKTVNLRNKFDGGSWQMRKSVKSLSREEFDALTSVVPGVYLGAKEMARRAVWWSKKYRDRVHPRPWMLWPGTQIPLSKKMWYDKKITSVARWLGATKEEIDINYQDKESQRISVLLTNR